MPAKRKKERIVATHFVWLLGQRAGVYYADGRSNQPSAGRHSLATKHYDQAREALQRLDLVQAVALGKADRALLDQTPSPLLSLGEGRRLYLEHVQRPRVVGGARLVSAQRYRAVFDKFETFAQGEGITTWNGVSRGSLEGYAAHLDDQGYAYATEYLELTTVARAAGGLIFHGPKGGKLKPDTVRRFLIRDLLTPLARRFPPSAEEVGFRQGRLHSFRHFFCSTCANKGVPEQVVMAWLGHSDSAMVRHYYHLHDDEAQRQMKRLDFVGNAASAPKRSDGQGAAHADEVPKASRKSGTRK